MKKGLFSTFERRMIMKKCNLFAVLFTCLSLFSCKEVREPLPAFDGLTSEETTFIRDSYLKKYPDDPDLKPCTYEIIRNHGDFNNCYFVEFKCYDPNPYDCFTVDEPYGHYAHWYINETIIETAIYKNCGGSGLLLTLCSKEGEIYDPQEAYDNGILTDDDVTELAKTEKYVDLYQKELKEKLDAYLENDSKV